MRTFLLGLGVCLAATAFAAQTEIKLITGVIDFAETIYKLSDTVVKQGKREVYFADTENFDFYREGVIFRIRTKKKKLQSTVKLRNLSPELFTEYSALTFGSQLDYKCEVDRTVGKSAKRSCSLSAIFRGGKVEKAKDFFTKKQIRFVADHLGKSRKEIKKLLQGVEVMGPISSRFYRFAPEGVGMPDEVDFVHWSLDGNHLYEVSANGVDISQKFSRFIHQYGLGREEDTTKTKWAMQLFQL